MPVIQTESVRITKHVICQAIDIQYTVNNDSVCTVNIFTGYTFDKNDLILIALS